VNPDNEDFQGYITRVAWGDIWPRPEQNRPRSRSIVVLSVLMTEGYWQEVPMLFSAAITNALTREEVRKVILQVGLDRGVPVANHATQLLRDAFGA